MNYANFNSSYVLTKSTKKTNSPDINPAKCSGYINKTPSKKPNVFDQPNFINWETNKSKTQTDQEIATSATRGISNGVLDEDGTDQETNPLTLMFFSSENMRRIQKLIRQEIATRTKGQYMLDEDQDESDLLVAMRAVFYDANIGARFLPFKIKSQVKKLNFHTVQYVVPDMIEAIKQYYGYIKEINEPLKPMMRPINVNSAGRKTLPSITTVYDF